MFSVVACMPGNSESEYITYTEQFVDQMIAAHSSLMVHHYNVLLLALILGIALGSLLTYLIFHFSNM